MKKQIEFWDFDAMRRFIIINTYHFKTKAVLTFDMLRSTEAYEEIYKWIENLGGTIVY